MLRTGLRSLYQTDCQVATGPDTGMRTPAELTVTIIRTVRVKFTASTPAISPGKLKAFKNSKLLIRKK